MPRVSIITPCYNSARFIEDTIRSVRAQSYPDWEQIVVDDGSTDDSAAVVARQAAEEPRLCLVRQPNGGVCKARNAGFAACCRDSAFLLFLDADDCPEPAMLATMVAYLDEHPDVGLVYCRAKFIDAAGNLLSDNGTESTWTPRYVPRGLGVLRLPEECAETPFVSVFCLAGIVPSIVVIRRSIYEETPGWDETFGQHYEDTDLFLQVALRSQVHYLPRSLVLHRRHGAQSTADPGKFARQERKLYAKWRRGQGLTREERAVVEAAWRFREGRLVPFQALEAGRRYLHSGQIGRATRFYLGAARRFAVSLVMG